jgi:type II secretory pathway pseudopilin PulG
MNREIKQSGFTLVETLIAAAITVGLTAAVFTLVRQNLNIFVVEKDVIEIQQNYRAGLDLIVRDVRAAGSGIPRFLGPIAGRNGASGAPDEIMLLFGDGSFAERDLQGTPFVGGMPTALVATGAAGTSYPSDEHYIIYTVYDKSDGTLLDSTDQAEFAIFKLASSLDLAGDKVLTPAATSGITLPAWSSTTNFPSNSRVRVTKLDEVVHYRVDPVTRELQRNRNSGGWVTVARGISDLQIQYRIEPVISNDPDDFGSGIVDEPDTLASNNRALIRSVIVTMTGATEDKKHVDGLGERVVTQTVEIAPRNLVLPGFIPNR